MCNCGSMAEQTCERYTNTQVCAQLRTTKSMCADSNCATQQQGAPATQIQVIHVCSPATQQVSNTATRCASNPETGHPCVQPSNTASEQHSKKVRVQPRNSACMCAAPATQQVCKTSTRRANTPTSVRIAHISPHVLCKTQQIRVLKNANRAKNTTARKV